MTTYVGDRRVLDADSHVMELADFLDAFIDPDYRDRLRRRGMEALAPGPRRRRWPGPSSAGATPS